MKRVIVLAVSPGLGVALVFATCACGVGGGDAPGGGTSRNALLNGTFFSGTIGGRGSPQESTVAANGAMTLAAWDSIEGGITADGTVAVLAGGTTNDDGLGLWIFLR